MPALPGRKLKKYRSQLAAGHTFINIQPFNSIWYIQKYKKIQIKLKKIPTIPRSIFLSLKHPYALPE